VLCTLAAQFVRNCLYFLIVYFYNSKLWKDLFTVVYIAVISDGVGGSKWNSLLLHDLIIITESAQVANYYNFYTKVHVKNTTCTVENGFFK
jgi:hypothetical protein